MGTTERLAVAILADRERPTSQHNIASCFSCGQTFVYKGRKGAASIWIGSDDDGHHSPDTSLNGRFCSKRCQDWHDAANPSYEQQREHERKLLVAPLDSFVVVAGPPNIEVGSKHHQRQTTPMRRGSEGFYVGLCTLPEGVREQGPAAPYPNCESAYRESEANRAIMAEVGIAPSAKHQCEQCGKVIPEWLNGRRSRAISGFVAPHVGKALPGQPSF